MRGVRVAEASWGVRLPKTKLEGKTRRGGCCNLVSLSEKDSGQSIRWFSSMNQ